MQQRFDEVFRSILTPASAIDAAFGAKSVLPGEFIITRLKSEEQRLGRALLPHEVVRAIEPRVLQDIRRSLQGT
ncbi:hypothetical protein LCGC14_2527340 [marine sediment metagenome]|uniref:Uncharacterized protein n=1 Tax=marine sediment metagenome TaxID=412755 RepID=A0A0F9BHH9_9ZZZZ